MQKTSKFWVSDFAGNLGQKRFKKLFSSELIDFDGGFITHYI
jgi:hypothetical protein